MHVDSFPIRPDWAETIATELEQGKALATLAQGGFLIQYSACLFFGRDFWEQQRPRLLLSEADLASAEYERFACAFPHHGEDSGAGYAFAAFAAGKEIVLLDGAAAPASAGKYGGVYGDRIFHLAGAYRYEKMSEAERAATNRAALRIFAGARRRLKRYLPAPLRRRTRQVSERLHETWERTHYDQARSELLRDPERYLERARRDSRRSSPQTTVTEP